MKEQLISFETAKSLTKVGGFEKSWGEVAYKKEDEKLYGDTGGYTDYPAPTQSLLQKWLREVHNIIVEPSYNQIYNYFELEIFILNNKTLGKAQTFSSYEQALEKGLQEALKLIKI